MGRPQFQQYVLAAPQEQFWSQVSQTTASLATNATETVQFFAPAGKIVRVSTLNFGLNNTPAAGNGATSGSHYVWVYVGGQMILYGTSAYNVNLGITGGFVDATTAKPPAGQNQGWWAGQICVDASDSVEFQYQNGTNVAVTIQRTYQVGGVAVVVGN